MTNFESPQPEKAADKEHLQAFLGDIELWAKKIIQDSHDAVHPTAGHTIITDSEKGIDAGIFVGELVDEFMIEYQEHHPIDSSKDFAVNYGLKKNRVGEFYLVTSGKTTEQITAEEGKETGEMLATPDQVKELHGILELATFGAVKFDFDQFQEEYDAYITDLEKMKQEADDFEQNNSD